MSAERSKRDTSPVRMIERDCGTGEEVEKPTFTHKGANNFQDFWFSRNKKDCLTSSQAHVSDVLIGL